MPDRPTPLRLAAAAFCLLFLAMGWGDGPALAGHSFEGDYGGVFMGVTTPSGPEKHFSYYATYNVDGAGGVTGSGYKSVQDGAAPPVYFSINTTYTLFLKEGVLLGPELDAPNRRHGRLDLQLNFGAFTSLWDDDEWHLGLIGYRGTVGSLGNSDLIGDYWGLRVQFQSPDAGSDAHSSAIGSESYNGAGSFTYTYKQNVQDSVIGGTVTAGSLYTLNSDGTLFRHANENGYWLLGGRLLATAKVNQDDEWGISLSLKKPDPGTCGLDTLQGPYWLAAYKFFYAGTPEHIVTLGEAFFDGAGSVQMRMLSNHQHAPFYNGIISDTYNVDSGGAFSWSSYVGGVGQNHVLVLAAEPYTSSSYGFMVLLKRSGLETLSPMYHLLGLTP